MKPVLLALLAVLLVPAPADAGSDLSLLQANAIGMVSYTRTDLATGATLCETDASLTVDAGVLTGAATWTARDCPGTASEVALFPAYCTDLCFLGCDVRETYVSCASYGSDAAGGWTWDRLLLERDGDVTLTRETGGPSGWTLTEMRGTLLVLTWP